MELIMRTAHFIRQAHAPGDIHALSALMQTSHMDSLKALGAAIKRRRIAKELTQTKLQEMADIGQSGVSRIESGKQRPEIDTLDRIAAALDTRASRLWAEADALMDSDDGESIAYQMTEMSGVRHVPLISWVDAGRGAEVIDSYARGTGEGMIKTLAKVGRLAYALRVDGASMTNPAGSEPNFPTGQVIIVDPHRSLESGSLIIARYADASKATFKRYVEDGSQRMLVPLNPQFPVIQIDQAMVYCGTVVAKAETEV